MTAALPATRPIACPTFCADRCAHPINGQWVHRSAGLTLDSDTTGRIAVYAARNDDEHDYRELGELGAPYVELELDTRMVWSDVRVMPRDSNHGVLAIDFTRDVASRFGGLLHNRAQCLALPGDIRVGPAGTRSDSGGEITIRPVRAARSGEHMVMVSIPVADFWSPDFGDFPETAGLVSLLLTVPDALVIGKAIEDASFAIWESQRGDRG